MQKPMVSAPSFSKRCYAAEPRGKLKNLYSSVQEKMKKIAPIVIRLFHQSDVAQLAADQNILNVNAFAKHIQPQVEKIAMKPATIGSISTALSRYISSQKIYPLKPKVTIKDIVTYTPVSTLTYQTHPKILRSIAQLSKSHDFSSYFFTLTQGPDEIMLIMSDSLIKKTLEVLPFNHQKMNSLAAVSIRFDAKYLEIPNMMYTLFSAFATKHINIMEIISTRTSITFVVKQRELQTTIEVLKPFVYS